MKRIVLFLVSLLFVVGMPLMGVSGNVNISIGVPPPLTLAGPPDVVVVPSGGSDVYLVPNTVGLYFYGGYWFRFHNDHWFRSTVYTGGWSPVGASLVPAPVVVIPPDYILSVPPGYHRIHYGDFHRHWKDWGHNHYWNKQAWYRNHSQHHWGGRDFHRGGGDYRPAGHHAGDVHHGGGVHKPPANHAGNVRHSGSVQKAPVNHAGDIHKSPAGGYKQAAHQGGEQHQ